MTINPPPLSELSPQYVHHDDGPRIATVAIAMMVLTVLSVLLRLVARRLQRQDLGLDDWIIIVGLAPAILALATSIKFSQHGLGKHLIIVLIINPTDPQRIQVWTFVKEIAYTAAIPAIKLSILALYLRLFPTKFTRTATKVLSTTVVIWCLVVLLLAVFQCRPIARVWDNTIDGTCFNPEMFFISISTTHIFLDILILSLPIREVKRLQMPTWTKFAVSAVFITGGFVTVVGIVRIVFVAQAYRAIEASPDADSTVLLVPTTIWTDIEVGFGVFCACIPTLRPILLKLQSFGTKVAKGANSSRHDNLRIKTDGSSPNPANYAYPSRHANGKESLQAFMPTPHEGYAKLPSLNSSHDLTLGTKIHAVSSKFGIEIPQHAISVQQDFQWEEEYRY